VMSSQDQLEWTEALLALRALVDQERRNVG
jgi:hypothetical protein